MESHISELQRELDKAKSESQREKKAREGAEQELKSARTQTRREKVQVKQTDPSLQMFV